MQNWLLKKLWMELALPVASIFNASTVQVRVPAQWKMADVIPIPKVHPVKAMHLQ